MYDISGEYGIVPRHVLRHVPVRHVPDRTGAEQIMMRNRSHPIELAGVLT